MCLIEKMSNKVMFMLARYSGKDSRDSGTHRSPVSLLL